MTDPAASAREGSEANGRGQVHPRRTRPVLSGMFHTTETRDSTVYSPGIGETKRVRETP